MSLKVVVQFAGETAEEAYASAQAEAESTLLPVNWHHIQVEREWGDEEGAFTWIATLTMGD